MIHCINPQYLINLLNIYQVSYSNLGQLSLIHGHDDYNQLIKVNGVFSNHPQFWPVDRTKNVRSSINLSLNGSWVIPKTKLNLEESLQKRVADLSSRGKKCNIFWSGGIDSTTVLTAFLKFCRDIDQIRVLYSPWSTYEHPGYINWLQKKYPKLEIIDISGDVYLNQEFDGLLITGDGGDESMASIDESFYSGIDHRELHAPWKKYFYKRLSPADHDVIDFFERFCLSAGRDIESLLEARWWFYITCKIDSILRENTIYLLSAEKSIIDITRLVGFFDCLEFVSFIYYNVDSIINLPGYCNWKQPLKQFCFDHNGFQNWYLNKTKFGSTQILTYYRKKNILNDQRRLLVLSTGEVLTTPNLPFINHIELDQHHPNLLKILLNDSVQI